MAEEIDFENGRISNFQVSTPRDVDLGSGHTAYSGASLIDLYLHTKFHSNWRNFLWTDGRTDVRTDRQIPRPALLRPLLGVDIKTHLKLAMSIIFGRLPVKTVLSGRD